MKPIEIVEAIKKDNPELLGKMPEQRAARIIREVLIQIAREVNATEEGVIKVPGLGNFNAKQVERKLDGAKVKRVIFTPAKAKAAPAA